MGNDTRFVNEINRIVNQQDNKVNFFNNFDTRKNNRNQIVKLKVNKLIDKDMVDTDDSLYKDYKQIIKHNDNNYNPHNLSNSIDIEDAKEGSFLKENYHFDNAMKNVKISKLNFKNINFNKHNNDIEDYYFEPDISAISFYKEQLTNEEDKLKKKLIFLQRKIEKMKLFLKKTEKFKTKPEWKKINTFQKKDKKLIYLQKNITNNLSSTNKMLNYY